MRSGISLLCLLSLLLFATCSDDDDVSMQPFEVRDLSLTLNPTGYAPLSAVLELSTDVPVTLRVAVSGQNGPESDAAAIYLNAATDWEIPVLGLYADHDNLVTVTISAAGVSETRELTVRTAPLSADMPAVRIDRSSTIPGANYYLVNYFGFAEEASSFRPQRPFIFDRFGAIRWYLDYSGHPTLGQLFYDNGLTRLRNGNLIMGDGTTDALYEIDRLGNILNQWDLSGFGFHHHVIELPNDNFLVTVNDPDLPTVEDVIIEIDRNGGGVVRVWDLNEVLDNRRRAWPTDLANLNVDWFHANGVEYDPAGDGIIVSGRTQGVVKLSTDNDLQWILAPHRDWALTGGPALDTFLLQPLDAMGNPITDPAVLNGTQDHPDFAWSWYQHSPVLLPNGNLLLFDNGDNRNYTSRGPYSRAVEYEIDADDRTIRQVWSYGAENGAATYARIVSKVSYYPTDGHVLFTPGSAFEGGEGVGKVVEVAHPGNEVNFEATVLPPQAPFNITFHNVIRVGLYGE